MFYLELRLVSSAPASAVWFLCRAGYHPSWLERKKLSGTEKRFDVRNNLKVEPHLNFSKAGFPSERSDRFIITAEKTFSFAVTDRYQNNISQTCQTEKIQLWFWTLTPPRFEYLLAEMILCEAFSSSDSITSTFIAW